MQLGEVNKRSNACKFPRGAFTCRLTFWLLTSWIEEYIFMVSSLLTWRKLKNPFCRASKPAPESDSESDLGEELCAADLPQQTDPEEDDLYEYSFDTYSFIKSLPPLEDCVPAWRRALLPKQTRNCKRKTLVIATCWIPYSRVSMLAPSILAIFPKYDPWPDNRFEHETLSSATFTHPRSLCKLSEP